MLTAIHRKKTKLASHRYDASSRAHEIFLETEVRDHVRYRRTQEDEIVSTVFGVLQYLPNIERTELLVNWFLPNLELEGYDISEMTFWPTLQGSGSEVFRVEPDLVIEFKDRSGEIKPKVVVIEAKWESPQSGEDQLVKQWFAAKKEWANPLHVFLVRSTEPQEVAANVFVDTWRELAGRIRQAQISKPEPEKHRRQLYDELLSFFSTVGITTFVGFGGIEFNSESAREPLNFWRRDTPFWRFGNRIFERLEFWNKETIK